MCPLAPFRIFGSGFYSPDALPVTQPTPLDDWRKISVLHGKLLFTAVVSVCQLPCAGRNDQSRQDLTHHSHAERSRSSRWCWRLRQTVTDQAGVVYCRLSDFPDYSHSVSVVAVVQSWYTSSSWCLLKTINLLFPSDGNPLCRLPVCLSQVGTEIAKRKITDTTR